MDNEKIAVLEDQLKSAMLNSDVSVLDELLADGLIFTNHLGQVTSKEDDIEAYRSGIAKIKSIKQSEKQIMVEGDAAIVSVLSHISGEFRNVQYDAALRFTRVWQKRESNKWQVIAAHSSLVTG
ncbi:MAG: nuclear transport factor 2 family protein [Calditrichia bacterium]